ncbi:unnamed protein product, partial [marine sediment metagenome]
EDFSFFNYIVMLKSFSVGLYYFNSGIVTSSVVGGVLLISSLAGYAIAKGSFRGKYFIFLLILATMMVPFQIIVVPLYILMLKIKLYDTRLALILPVMANGYSIFLMIQYMKSIPDELLDAARIDGCNELKIMWQIVLPLCKPVLAALAVLNFLWNWNSFLWPLIALEDMNKFTIPIGIAFYQQQFSVYYGTMMAAATVAIIPVLILFVLVQRYVVRGIALTGLKL